EDVDVGLDARGVVECPRADEANGNAPPVAAEQRDPAAGTAPDDLVLSRVAWNGDRLGLPGDQLDPIGLDQEVDDERAPGLPLTVEAMAAVDEERLRREPVAHLTARAAALADGH